MEAHTLPLKKIRKSDAKPGHTSTGTKIPDWEQAVKFRFISALISRSIDARSTERDRHNELRPSRMNFPMQTEESGASESISRERRL